MKCAALFLLLFALATPAFAAEHVHWSYHGEGGPAHWGDIEPGFAACKAGAMQSPIDLAAANAGAAVTVEIAYKPVPLQILHNGHTVQFNVENGSAITLHGTRYTLLQVHFHTPSEHLTGGATYPLEAHFVHMSEAGALAVIGILFAEGAENRALAPLFRHLPMHESPATAHADASVDLAAILPSDRGLYRYMGSLTTPPCSEGVNWMVMKAAVPASKAQINALHKAMGDNARPVQKPGNRLIVEPK